MHTIGASRFIRSARTPFPTPGVVNSASLDIVARDRVTITGGIQAGDAIDINVGGTQSTDSAGKVTTTGGADYKYTIVTADTISTIVNALTNMINAANSGDGDTNVYATPDLATGDVILTSRVAGTAGNNITVYVTVTRGQRIHHGANRRHGRQFHSVRRRRCGPDRAGQHRFRYRHQSLVPYGIGRSEAESSARISWAARRCISTASRPRSSWSRPPG